MNPEIADQTKETPSKYQICPFVPIKLLKKKLDKKYKQPAQEIQTYVPQKSNRSKLKGKKRKKEGRSKLTNSINEID